MDMTAANAMLIVGDDVLTASGPHGNGSITVHARSGNRLVGSFSLVVSGTLAHVARTLVHVNGGVFDVPL